MKSVAAVAIVTVALASQAAAYSSSSFTGNSAITGPQNAGTSSLSMEYIPSGMSKAQWAKVKEAEKNKSKGKNLGKTGITSFKSRTFDEWQKSGGKNLFPVDPNKVKDVSEIPYMQRKGGKPDDSDLKGKGGAKAKGGGGGGWFGKKKAAPAPEPEPVVEEKKNWWTL